jgi:hypothetical protein
MLIYLAALEGMDPTYYDAARIDGARTRQVTRFETCRVSDVTHVRQDADWRQRRNLSVETHSVLLALFCLVALVAVR